MSLFRGEAPVLSLPRLDPTSAPTKSTAPLVPVEGMFWNDVTQRALQMYINSTQQGVAAGLPANVTPVTATNPNPTGNLMSIVLPANFLNAVGKTLYIWGAGLYTTAAAQTPTITISVTVAGVTILSLVSTATTASVTNFPWNIEGYLTVQANRTTAAIEGHGILNVLLGSVSTAAINSFNDTSTAVSSTFDSTASQTLQVVAAMSSSNAGNSVVQRQLLVEVIN